MTIQVVDFFSGCGGTSLGLEQAGMSIAAGIDNDPDAAATYRENFPKAKFFERDIQDISVEEVGQLMTSSEMVFAGCAPCQPFSRQNRSSKVDGRRLLLGEFQRFVTALRPGYVVVENVPGLQRVGSDGPLTEFIAALEAVGYRISWDILHASHFGVPQRRTRFVLVASLLKGGASLPQETYGPKRRQPSRVRDWMSGLPTLSAGSVHPDDQDHAAMALSDLNMERIRATPEGGGREAWPDRLLLECHAKHSGHSDVYGRLAWDRPASAMTTRCLSYSNGRFGHPEEDRAISVREAACLQTFPRTFKFSGTVTSRGRQVGNAVPPLLAKRIGQVITGERVGRSGAPTLF
jgi:DNA (cytosine-5)-methyltransferase 1